jgi:hypothetical protein
MYLIKNLLQHKYIKHFVAITCCLAFTVMQLCYSHVAIYYLESQLKQMSAEQLAKEMYAHAPTIIIIDSQRHSYYDRKNIILCDELINRKISSDDAAKIINLAYKMGDQQMYYDKNLLLSNIKSFLLSISGHPIKVE